MAERSSRRTDDEQDERESLRLLRALVETMSAFRETHLRTGISVKNLEKYHYEMITSMRLLLGGLKEERHETERRVSELVASNEQLRRIVADQITESNKAYRSIIWRFFILITGILMGVGVYRIATV